MDEIQRLAEIDHPFYYEVVAPWLPERVLDFHVHIWRTQDWGQVPWESGAAGGKYMVVEQDYDVDHYARDVQNIYPDRICESVCFGYPNPAANLPATNAYTASLFGENHLFPLMIVGKETVDPGLLEEQIFSQNFFGYKVMINWLGNDYGGIRMEDMLGAAEMALADKHRLIVLWHVPRSGRLADPIVQEGLRRYAQDYPGAQIVLAHCGRCYLPDEMSAAVDCLVDLENVWLDTSMVMDPTVIEILLDNVAPERLLYATDLPVAAMRGRRVYVMDHWVDVVLPDSPESAYRVRSEGIRATFMVYEIILALVRGGQRSGLSEEQIRGFFHAHGHQLLRKARAGEPYRALFG